VPVEGAAPHPYDRHVGRYGAQLAAALIDAAGIEPEDRVLDVGCGTGQLTRALAERVGGGNVTAIDPAAGVVEVCRQRVPDADVRVGSAESLPFADGEFDAVLAQLVVNLVGDPPAAVREMARVAAEGAPVAACVWDDDEMPLLRAFWDAARTAAPAELAGIEDKAQVGLEDLGLLRAWWERAGLREIALSTADVGADYNDFDDLWFSFASGVGRSGALFGSLSQAQQAAVRDDAFRRLGSPDGPFRLEARAHIIRGTA
jgi:SAM-dependent methyltransferase